MPLNYGAVSSDQVTDSNIHLCFSHTPSLLKASILNFYKSLTTLYNCVTKDTPVCGIGLLKYSNTHPN
jgi:hypothetical protein